MIVIYNLVVNALQSSKQENPKQYTGKKFLSTVALWPRVDFTANTMWITVRDRGQAEENRKPAETILGNSSTLQSEPNQKDEWIFADLPEDLSLLALQKGSWKL